MATGRLCDTNLTATASITGVGWSEDLPLTHLQDDSRYVGAPARCVNPADLSASRFEVTLERPRAISLIAPLFHTMSLGAKYRLTIAGRDLDLEDPAYATGWKPVYGRLFKSASLPWEQSNWWTGQTTADEIDLYRRHRWIPFPTTIAGRYRLEFDDVHHPDGYFDIGGLWTAAGFSPAINFERGRELGLASRDVMDEAPSGRRYYERRTARRSLSLNWQQLSEPEVYRFFDAGARLTTSRPCIFLPDTDQEAGLIREAFPATLQAPPRPKFTYARSNQVGLVLEEIIA